MQIELASEDVAVLIEALVSRKRKADGRKNNRTFSISATLRSDEAALSERIGNLLKILRGKQPQQIPAPAVIVDVPADSVVQERLRQDLQALWNAKEPCRHCNGPMTPLEDNHWRQCPVCGFRQWSTLDYHPAPAAPSSDWDAYEDESWTA